MNNDKKQEYETPTLKLTLFANKGDFLIGSGEKTENDPFSDNYGFSF